MKSRLLKSPVISIVMLSMAATAFCAVGQKLSVSNPEVSLKLAAEGAQLIADYGSYQLWTAPADTAAKVAGEQGVAVVEGEDVIELSAGPINTAAPPPPPGKGVVAEDFSGKRLHLVQFAGPIMPEWRASLVKAGLKVVAYVPRNSYLVYGDSASLGQFRVAAASTPHVQWEEAYLPEEKIHPRARAAAEKATRKELTDDLFAIQLVEDEAANAQSLQFLDEIRRELIRRSKFLGYVNVVLRLPPERLAEVAALPDVVSIQPYAMPKKRDERQGQILAGNLTGGLPSSPGYLDWLVNKGFTADQFAASGFGVDVSDSGIDNGTTSPNHPNLHALGDPAQPARVLYNRLVGTPNSGSTLQGCDGHGNLNSHIIAGYNDLSGFPHTDSLGYHYGLGIAPFVRVGSSVIFDPDYFTNPDYSELQSRAYQDGARVSCNSWGSRSYGAYTSDSQAYDALVRDAQPSGSPFPAAGNQEMVIVFSAGNDGSSANSIGAPGTGKNIISVGASENAHSHSTANGGNNSTGNDGCDIPDTGADNANDIIYFSSRGPCDDGRVKPDIVGPGTHVTGGVGQQVGYGSTGTALACFEATGVCGLPGSGTVGSPNNFFPLGQQFYSTSSGTSHSCPALGGGAALLRQYFINQTWPAPSPAMTKAWLMNAGRYMTGLYANDTLPSNNQGMGLLNLGAAFDGVLRIHRDQLEEDRFTASGQVRAFDGLITDPTKPFRVTLAWTDAPGSTLGSAYNNNLNLTVTVGGQTYRGNFFSGAVSVAGGTNDPRNNVESVFLPAGLTGEYIITVSAANINSDGVPGNADALDQDFALVVYNSTDSPVLPIPAGATVTAESCSPGQGIIDPGETVTVELGLRNNGPSNSVALVATLLATNGVVGPSGPQDYGVLVGGGAVVSRPFTFSTVGRCGGSISVVLQLQDGTNDYGLVAFPFTLGLLATNTSSSSHGTPITISALDGSVLPYPSPITISALSGAISKITVTLNDLTHTWPDDLDVLLVGPQGQSVLLLSDAGGGNNMTNLTLVFDDAALAPLPDEEPLMSGAWKPTNFEEDSALPTPAPLDPFGSALSVFNGASPNGTWQLFVADDYTSDDGGILAGGWALTIVTTNHMCCLDPTTVDLALSLHASPEPVALSNTVTYTMTVANSGPALATGVVVTNLLPVQAAFVSASVSQGTVLNVGGVVSWSLGNLAVGANASAQIVANVVGGPTLLDQARVVSSQTDNYPPDNEATVTTTVSVPQLSVEDVAVVEGDAGSRPAVFIVTLSQICPLRVDVDYMTVAGTATPNGDYLPMTNTLHFFPGDVAQTIEIPVIADTMDEEDETFRVVLTNPVNAGVVRDQGTATIIDDDPMPAVSIGDVAVFEGQSGTNIAIFPVTLARASERSVLATCTTSNSTAIAGPDFTALTRTFIFAPGQTSTNFIVSINGDTINEPDETFLAQLSVPVNAVLGRATGVGTILTDDIGPLLSVVFYRLTAESQSPPNGVVDAGETVTLSVALRNDGSANTTNLIATLLPGNGVVSPSGPQSYGVLIAGGAQVSRPFTFTAGISNCATLRAGFQLQDGTASLGTQTLSIIVGNCFADDFEPDIDLPNWAAFGGTVGSTVIATNYGGSVSPPNSLWFGDGGSRFARTRPLNTTCGGTVSFYIRLANGSAWPWENVDSLTAEGVVLEYSTDGGATWTIMGGYTNSTYYAWTAVTAPIPLAAQAPATQFQWRQLSHSGSLYDHWALDSVMILSGPSPARLLAQPASQTVRPGTNVTFCVTATGCVPITYQWRRSGTNLVNDSRISGATSACLSITNTLEADSGQYSVAVSNMYGGEISSNATLLVSPLDHFVWGEISSPQVSGVPFLATITARDADNNPVPNYGGCVTLSRGGVSTNIVGTGTSTVNYPLGTFYHDERTQVIYQPGEIGAAGRITALALDVSSLPERILPLPPGFRCSPRVRP
ncbi:MAG TPA: S8 family serine peptidase, partial [Verrucomicrobiota bacterium]|nr:S8 family serine peptidase [Verrucomicrobiota bacterium]